MREGRGWERGGAREGRRDKKGRREGEEEGKNVRAQKPITHDNHRCNTK